MRKYIIVILCLLAVLGCSDDKGTNVKVDKFPLIEAMVLIDPVSDIKDTIGDKSKVGNICDNTKDDNLYIDLYGFENISFGYTVNTKQLVKVEVETVKISESIRASLVKRFHQDFKDPEKYFIKTVFEGEKEAKSYVQSISRNDFEPGVYLIKLSLGIDKVICTPAIFFNLEK